MDGPSDRWAATRNVRARSDDGADVRGARRDGCGRRPEPEPAAVPFPADPSPNRPAADRRLVPVTPDDLPGDDDAVPHIEVGGPRPKTPAGPQLLPPKSRQRSAGARKSRSSSCPGEMRPPAGPPAAGSDRLPPPGPSRRPPIPPAGRRDRRPASRRPAAGAACSRRLRPGRPERPRSPTWPSRGPPTGSAASWSSRPNAGPARRPNGSASRRCPACASCSRAPCRLALALHRTAVEGVYLMPAGKTSVGTDEAARLPALLDQLRGPVRLDPGRRPGLGTHPLDDWAQASDGVYLVLRPDEWDSPHADMAHDGIARAGGQAPRLRHARRKPAPIPSRSRRRVSERSRRTGTRWLIM